MNFLSNQLQCITNSIKCNIARTEYGKNNNNQQGKYEKEKKIMEIKSNRESEIESCIVFRNLTMHSLSPSPSFSSLHLLSIQTLTSAYFRHLHDIYTHIRLHMYARGFILTQFYSFIVFFFFRLLKKKKMCEIGTKIGKKGRRAAIKLNARFFFPL